MYRRKWRPSKTDAKEFAIKMEKIGEFCKENNIKTSMNKDSYYFEIDGKNYRVSNHTVAKSDKGMYKLSDCGSFYEKQRDSYHKDAVYFECFTASKSRIIDIYSLIKKGVKLNKRGFPLN